MAANIERGEFDVAYDGRMLTFKQTMTPARQSQKRSKKTVGELYFAAGRNDVEAIRELLWMLLQAFHADEFKALDDVDAVFDANGGPRAFFDYLNALSDWEEARKKSFTAPDEGVSEGNP